MNFIAKLFAVIQGLMVVLVTFSATPTYAHGEKAQQPALRMRTVHWFDVDLSTRKLDVNQILVVCIGMDSFQMPFYYAKCFFYSS